MSDNFLSQSSERLLLNAGINPSGLYEFQRRGFNELSDEEKCISIKIYKKMFDLPDLNNASAVRYALSFLRFHLLTLNQCELPIRSGTSSKGSRERDTERILSRL